MAKLYQVFYFGHAFDSDRRLPAPSNDIAYAHNSNGAGEYLIPAASQWIEVTRDEALKRAGQYTDPVRATGRTTEEREAKLRAQVR